MEIGKFSGTGNDFIIIDNRENVVPRNLKDFIIRICKRRLSIGADGLILIESSKKAHYRITYYNCDGSFANLCINGTRCAARYAFLKVIAPKEHKIETDAGVFGAEILGKNVKLSFPTTKVKINELKIKEYSGFLVDVGVPHLIIPIEENLYKIDFLNIARDLRWAEELKPEGANVSFVSILEPNIIFMRTYERGIEDEVLSCSSGSWAAIYALNYANYPIENKIEVANLSGIPLYFEYEKKKNILENLKMEGDARLLFFAKIERETYIWGP